MITLCAIINQPALVARHVHRTLFFSSTTTGYQWPFKLNPYQEIHQFVICDQEAFFNLQRNEWPHLLLSTGPIADDDNSPTVITRLNKKERYGRDKKTSQGKVYAVSIKVSNTTTDQIITETEVLMILKVNRVHAKRAWLESKKKYVQTPQCNQCLEYHVVEDSYVDALCSVLVSDLVERNQSPHFPICYGTSVAQVHIKSGSSGGVDSQLIWMEYLPKGIKSVLKNCTDEKVWWSVLFQIFAALNVAHHVYGFVHNDLHRGNIRFRKVPKDSFIYYKNQDGRIIKIFTYGILCVLIDYGRSSVQFQNKNIMSSTFTGRGACSGFDPRNRTIDTVRLLTSLYQTLQIVSEKEKLVQFFLRFTTTGQDPTKGESLIYLLERDTVNANRYLDEIPRKFCTYGLPELALQEIATMFEVTAIDRNIENIENVFPLYF